MFELTVTLKGEEQSYKQKFVVYEEMNLTCDDPVLRRYIEEAQKGANFNIDECKIRCSMEVPLALKVREAE